MNKKGESLPLNTLVIIILVVIVLIVVAVFFLGGTSSLSRSIRNIFYGTTAGTDVTLAREICTQRCEAARDAPDSAQTAYCRTPFELDVSPEDGKVDVDSSGNSIKYYCSGGFIGVSCPNINCPSQD